MLIRFVSGLKLAGTLRTAELVHTYMKGAAAVAGFAIVTRRVARTHRIDSWGSADGLANIASLPSAVAA